jgi:hypothetical protein
MAILQHLGTVMQMKESSCAIVHSYSAELPAVGLCERKRLSISGGRLNRVRSLGAKKSPERSQPGA